MRNFYPDLGYDIYKRTLFAYSVYFSNCTMFFSTIGLFMAFVHPWDRPQKKPASTVKVEVRSDDFIVI